MADEQYAWLDKEAAEKLLRGEPVDPAEGRPCQDAERLAAALAAAARTALPATGELPGEAAALAAFRAAPRPPRTAPGTGPDRAEAAHGDGADDSGPAMLPAVHIGRAASGAGAGAAGPRGERPFRWSRPLRFGLVASLACCAIGGVAVAAGTGVLPGPFGRHDPSPATSVSAAASPEELGSGPVPDDEAPVPPQPGSPDLGAPSPDAPAPGTDRDGEDTAHPDGTAPEGGRSGTDGDGTDRSGGSRSGGGTGTADDTSGGGSTDTEKGNGRSDDDDDTSAAWYAKTLKACRAYRDGTLDQDRRAHLEALAKGAHNLDRFCDRLLDKAGDGSDGRVGDEGNAEHGGEPSGALPSIRFTESPGPTAAAIVPDPATTDSGTFYAPEPTASAAAR
ncbi:hypothetical protein E6P78_12640 [Streptomyces sp. A0958]|uniref:hypothetical protein n=1 Tax=Streptomyces sp. A0958 TaxID=2563101 RepID=UPI00109ECA57|nr:hypothetical protein [Streptomyces sp. A0958]THA69262.1 hypothetical protein E6P78_12640 [Streptomyces sp. A0958]